MTTVRQQLPATAQALVAGAGTSAGANVFLWRDWSLDTTKMPAVVFRARRADRNDLTGGNGIPHFMATVWLEAECFAASPNPGSAETVAETLAEDQMLPLLMGLIIGPPQTFFRCSAVESEIEPSAQGDQHIAVAKLRLAFEYEEQYAPVLTEVLQRIVIVALKPTATDDEIAAIRAALNAGDSDVTIAGLAGVLAGADLDMTS